MNKTIFITGGAGFIGSALVRYLIGNAVYTVVNIDKLTYAGNLESLANVSTHHRYVFSQTDINDREALYRLFMQYHPCGVIHLAAESHVDRSIDSPYTFIKTNIEGTYQLLEATLKYWQLLSSEDKSKFRFHHISTDEVYGDLGKIQGGKTSKIDDSLMFTEQTAYAPSSPYSASKAASDHLVRAWWRTYGLPIVVTSCSNNYGPYQFPEKLIPTVILSGIAGRQIPVYGQGNQIRDWLYVEDHVSALWTVFQYADIGETYNISGYNTYSNINVVEKICAVLDELYPTSMNANISGIRRYSELITFVEDRPGHDVHYAVNATKISNDLGWAPVESFDSGIRKTVKWYLQNHVWWENLLKSKYSPIRLGLAK